MTAPTTSTEWATNAINDATYGDNKVATTTHLKDDGLDPLEAVARPYLNYQLDSLDQWIKHIVNDLLGTGTESVLQKVFPVGGYYTSGTTSADPNTILGFGTWVQVEGKFIVGQDTGDTDFDTLLETGGSKTLTGSTDSHTLLESEIPAHNHDTTFYLNYTDFTVTGLSYGPNDGGIGTDTETTDSTGGGAGHSHTLSAAHLPPYEVASVWRRTA